MYARDEAVIATPVGSIVIEGDANVVIAIRILTEPRPTRRAESPAVLAAAEQLEAWFDGALTAFDLALARPATMRGQELRTGLINVGYGTTTTYGALAASLGSSSRAVGQLCARNPFPIVVPCHRVLASGAGADRYSAGAGPVTKQWLIAFERSRAGVKA